MTSSSVYTVCMATGFLGQAFRVPREVQKKLEKDVFPRLESGPTQSDPPTLGKLASSKTAWRYRVGNYRIVYNVDDGERVVTLLGIGHRGRVYDRLGYPEPEGQTVLVTGERPDLVRDGDAMVVTEPTALALPQAEDEPSGVPDGPLPALISDELLDEAGIPNEFWPRLQQISTEGELCALDDVIESRYVEALLDQLYPRRIQEVFDCPARVVESAAGLGAALKEERTLESFLLKLDESQKPIVDRFKEPHPSGPWVVKGGPGTGKSTLALYCIRELITAPQQDFLEDKRGLQILFTTFTNSLIDLSRHLFREIRDESATATPTITNVDKIAYSLLDSEWKRRKAIGIEALTRIVGDLIYSRRGEFPFDPESARFLAEEIDDVIFGNALQDERAYLEAGRRGRGRPLGASQRKDVWKIFQAVLSQLEEKNLRTFRQTVAMAEEFARPRFDYVFIDEAQDLSSSSIRLCIKLCKTPKHVFLTADLNQSIYGSGISWASIDKALDMRGRSQILRRNFRTTVEICDAIDGLASGQLDEESRLQPENAVYHGEFPVFFAPKTPRDEIDQIEKFLQHALLDERMTKNAAVVLCPTNRDCDEIAAALAPRFNARAMKGSSVDFEHPGVLVMTIHTAKGLEFGIVVAARIDRTAIESPLAEQSKTPEDDDSQKNRRLLFVACSRAIRRLMVSTRPGAMSDPPPLISEDYWDVWAA